MIKLEIKDSNGKVIGKIISYLDYGKEGMSKEMYIRRLVEGIELDQDVGYAGFKGRDGLKSMLEWQFLDYGDIDFHIVKDEKYLDYISDALLTCKEFIGNKKIHIFVFPVFDKLVIEKMNGCTGISVWNDTITLFLKDGKIKKETVKSVVCHELAHAISLRHLKRITILDGIVFEGVAEHFMERTTGIRSFLGRAVTKEKIGKIFKEIELNLDKEDFGLYRQLFYGKDGKYPMWTGYSIGYYLVENYLKKQKQIDWNVILKTPTKKILLEARSI